MPTKRAWIFLVLALVLYFLANQTQVGWIYIIADGLVGLLLAACFYTWGLLKPIRVKRTYRMVKPPGSTEVSTRSRGNTASDTADLTALTLPTFHEDDPIEITLRFSSTGLRPALLVSGQEICPLAPAADQKQTFFIPSLTKGRPVDLTYQTYCDRRGFYHFPGLELRSKGAFGLFSARRSLATPGEILVYPSYHPLKRLRALERWEITEWQTSKTGIGSQVIGTREYRSGDSLRQIHWRSTARLGKLVVKEFSNDEQTTLIVVLDLAATGNVGDGKFSTFETAIRIAASLAYYATHKNIPFYLAGSTPAAGQTGQRLAPPPLALSWWAVLNYLAKVSNNGDKPLAKVLADLTPSSYVVVLISNPADEALASALRGLRHKGVQVLAIFITLDGVAPPIAHSLPEAGLETKSVSPSNWPSLLAE